MGLRAEGQAEGQRGFRREARELQERLDHAGFNGVYRVREGVQRELHIVVPRNKSIPYAETELAAIVRLSGPITFESAQR